MDTDNDNSEYPYVEAEVGDGLGIEATILSHKWRETQWGEQHSMLLEVDLGYGRYKIYGPVPKSLEQDFDPVGMRISMIANLKQSDDDPTFGFFSRPRSASYMA